MANKVIGLLTAGGDCPGLNAAIRGVGKAALALGMQVIGYYDVKDFISYINSVEKKSK